MNQDLSNIWRAFVSGETFNGRDEKTVFARANSREEALATISSFAESAFPGCAPEMRVYNLYNGLELTARGDSVIEGWRLFETGWNGDGVALWCLNPVFLDGAEFLDSLYVAAIESNKSVL